MFGINTKRREALLEWVKIFHGLQKRKYTGEDYWHHPLSVAINSNHLHALAYEIALCHDVFEDTLCGEKHLRLILLNIGYSIDEADFICEHVHYLSDVYTHEAYPDLNRVMRKEKESLRLSEIPELAQSIKYVDMIDNSFSIGENDEQFAEVYFREIKSNLSVMRNGDFQLLTEICTIVENYQSKQVKLTDGKEKV